MPHGCPVYHPFRGSVDLQLGSGSVEFTFILPHVPSPSQRLSLILGFKHLRYLPAMPDLKKPLHRPRAQQPILVGKFFQKLYPRLPFTAFIGPSSSIITSSSSTVRNSPLSLASVTSPYLNIYTNNITNFIHNSSLGKITTRRCPGLASASRIRRPSNFSSPGQLITVEGLLRNVVTHLSTSN